MKMKNMKMKNLKNIIINIVIKMMNIIKNIIIMFKNFLINFFIFLKNIITNVKFLLTLMLSSLVILELAKFFNKDLGYFYYFSLTPATLLVYIAYDKCIVPIITRIIIKLFNLNKFHNYISPIIALSTRLFILYYGGMGYFICTYFSFIIETYNISLIPVFNSINKNIIETIYNSKIFNSINKNIFETIYNSKMFNSVNNNIIEIIYKLFNIVNNNIINMFKYINNNIIKTIYNLNLFINENNIILKNINNNIIETIYTINININNIFNNIFNNTNSINLIIDKNIIINNIKKLFNNKLYLYGCDDYIYHNDFKVKIVAYQTGTPEGIEASNNNPENGSISANVSSNQGSQPVSDVISNNTIRSRPAPYTNEDLIKWGINELDFSKFKFNDIILPCKFPNADGPIEIIRGYVQSSTPRTSLVYLNKDYTMSRIEIDESKVVSLYNKEIDKYYDPVHGIWWNHHTGRWIDSDLYYLRGGIKIDHAIDTRIKTSNNKYTIVFINRAIKNLSFDDFTKKLLRDIADWNVVHLNAIEYVRPDNSPIFTSKEAGRSYMLNLNESTIKAYAHKLWCADYPIRYYDRTVTELLLKKSEIGISRRDRENISILIDQIIAMKCQTMYLNKCLSNYYLLLEKDYKWLQSSQMYMEDNEKRFNSMYKKPSADWIMSNSIVRNSRNINK